MSSKKSKKAAVIGASVAVTALISLPGCVPPKNQDAPSNSTNENHISQNAENDIAIVYGPAPEYKDHDEKPVRPSDVALLYGPAQPFGDAAE